MVVVSVQLKCIGLPISTSSRCHATSTDSGQETDERAVQEGSEEQPRSLEISMIPGKGSTVPDLLA